MKKIWLISALLGMLTASVLFLFLSKPVDTATPVPKTAEEPHSQVSDAFQETAAEPLNDSAQSNLPITYGKRAVTIAVNDIQGVAGVLKKDDYVDVISLISPDGDSRFMSQIILQQIKVLAVGSYQPYTPAAPEAESAEAGASAEAVQTDQASSAETSTPADSAADLTEQEVALPYAMVTLEVLPDEGAKLALAANSGSLVLMLRPRQDPTKTKHQQFTADQLIKGEMVK